MEGRRGERIGRLGTLFDDIPGVFKFCVVLWVWYGMVCERSFFLVRCVGLIRGGGTMEGLV